MDNNLIAFQANDLIRSNQSALNLTEKRILLYLISLIKKTDEDFKYYRISVKEFASLLPNKGHNETLSCMSACDSLMDKKVKISFKDHETSTRLVLKSKYYVGSGYFDVLLDDEIKPLLLNLKDNFTQVYIKQAMGLTSVNAIRLYEILLSWNDTKKMIISPEKLKEILGVENKYKKFSQFKANCLKPAFKMIIEKTDINSIDMTEERFGRKVKTITITFSRKENLPISNKNEVNEYSKELSEKLISLGIHHLKNYKGEGITEEDWIEALSNSDSIEASHLVTFVRTIKNQRRNQSEGVNINNKIDKSVESNYNYFIHKTQLIQHTRGSFTHSPENFVHINSSDSIKWTEPKVKILEFFKEKEPELFNTYNNIKTTVNSKKFAESYYGNAEERERSKKESE